MPADAQRVQAVFQAALEAPDPAARAALLEHECAAEPELARRVQALLGAYENPASILDRHAASALEVTVDTPAERPGAVIGPYKLLQQIGEGGMGTVWMAQQSEPVKRLVALKLIKTGMDSKQVIARFEAERQALAMMDHVNIAKVLDGGTASSGRPYFVMDLVKGVPITRYCDEHHLTPRERLELFVPVCQAVQHAHQKGIIHRDLKPSNVLVALYDGKPVPKVIDFGVAKAAGQSLTEKTLVTGFGSIIGTFEYMSPEQAEINQLDIDTRSDIYSLGVLLYELLTGSTPFSRKDLEKAGMLEMLRVIREQEPSKPSTKLSTAEGLPTLAANRGTEPAKLTRLVRGELDWIVMKALEKDRNRRYETANGFAMDVQRYLADEAVQACPPSTWYRLRKVVRRHKVLLTSAATVALVLLVGTVVSTWQAVRAIQAEKLAAKRLAAETEARLAANDARRLAQHRLYDANVNQARARRVSGQIGARAESLKVLEEAARLGQSLELEAGRRLTLRNEVIACLALHDVQVVQEWDGYPSASRAVAFAADLGHYARGDTEGVIRIYRVEDGQEVSRLREKTASHSLDSLRFSPDGRLLAAVHQSSGGRHLAIWDLKDRRIHHRVDEASAVDFSGDARLAAIARGPHVVDVVDLETRKLKHSFRPSLPGVGGALGRRVRFDPSGKRLAVWNQDGRGVEVWSLDSGKAVWRFSLPDCINHLGRKEPGRNYDLAWHPDKPMLAVGSERAVYLWDLELGTAAEVLKGHEDAAVGVLFGSTGDMLVSASWDGTARIWHPTGRQLARMPASEVFLGRDGRLAVRHGTRLAIVKVAQGPEYRSLYDRGARVPVRLLAIDPHSRVLLSAGETRLHLWDLETGNILERLRGAVHSVQFAADGRHVLTAGPTDMHRWPVHWDADVARLRLGPPERVAAQVPRPLRWSALSSGAGALVVPAGAHDALVVDCKTGAVKCRLADHTNISCAAVSPDGRWLATGSWHGVEARVWDADNGALLRRFPHAIGIGHSFVGFSPDGKWLALCFGSEYQLVEVGVWEVRRRLARDQVVELPGPACFSPDGRLLAMTRTPHVVKLVDADTGDEVATLSLPQTATLTLMCFSQDGSRLVAGGSDAIHVWDLRRIRERLADMGLDWNAPALVEDQQPRKPVHLELDLGALAPARK